MSGTLEVLSPTVRASAVVTKHRFVVATAAGWRNCNAIGEPADAVALTGADAIGDAFTAERLGIAKVESGAAIALHDRVGADALGRAIPAGEGPANGIALDAAAAAGEFVSVLWDKAPAGAGGATSFSFPLSDGTGAGGILSQLNPLGVPAAIVGGYLVRTTAGGAGTADVIADNDTPVVLLDDTDVTAAVPSVTALTSLTVLEADANILITPSADPAGLAGYLIISLAPAA